MKLKILGSGGCRALPRPTCRCKVCIEARKKGEPFKRTGPSLFIEGENILIDTPEEIVYQLNREGIEKVNYILYSHWDPDHTLGMRVVEQLQESSWIKDGGNPVQIRALREVYNDINDIQNKFGGYFEYYKSKNLCKFEYSENFKVNNLTVKLYPVRGNIIATVFLFEENRVKVIYAPCDIKPFPYIKDLENVDLLIIGCFVPDNFITDEKIFGTDIVMYSDLYTANEIIKIKKDLGIKRVIITHLEEEWKLSYDDYKLLEKTYNGEIEFAKDGMSIIL
ncbi:MBL fold metallo-hydrolase [uncultured Clostridium sp.]|jgi:phosphoribosyl 1,2-cyclic phosphate phosphodiesterase|uniref:MBL fold metallo-hydrolase n=1 Tax=uncultured Clostridium sp. TaxID=59620 RepID=UPI0026221899|nr:MBL fold metallo-hydrolase [uncultured Clostridium sp.]